MRMSVPSVLSDLIDTHNDLNAPCQMKRRLSNEGPQILLKRWSPHRCRMQSAITSTR